MFVLYYHFGVNENSGLLAIDSDVWFTFQPLTRHLTGAAVWLAVLEYALELLTHENTMGLPHDLRPAAEHEGDADDLLAGAEPLRTPLFVTMFYNDETHTFEQVTCVGRHWWLGLRCLCVVSDRATCRTGAAAGVSLCK